MLDSLLILSQCLWKHYGQKVVILVDEYDVPLDKAYQAGYYDDMVELLRNLFGQASTRIYPIILWPCRRIHLKRMTVVYNIPGTVYIHLTKPIPVIPFPDREGAFVMSDKILQDSLLILSQCLWKHYGQKVVILVDFPVRKAKIFIILHILDRVYTEIIQPRKNALL